MNIQSEIKRVLTVQASSLIDVKKHVGIAFRDAVLAIHRCKGKVMVTGIGKSGIVAQKIASTFSSTGTPAIFMHPAEGMHGNIGVLQKSDIVLAIGKSGESEEVLSILPTIHRIGAKVISITSNKNSSLAKHSTIVLYVPMVREACPLNLAPTTSSTVALVIGDALAIALMKLKGFDEERFAFYHPGGLLGRRLLLHVSDVMRGGRMNPVVHKDDSMPHLLIEMSRKWAGAVSVVDDRKRLTGLVTDFDVRQAFAREEPMKSLRIQEIMNHRPTFIYADELAVKALRLMESRKKPFTVLPVVDRKKRAVGMIHLHDLVRKGIISEHPSLF